MASRNHAPEVLSGGVEALIERLREEGVAAGRAEADRIVREAEERAARIVADAEREAKTRREAARKESESYRAAGEAALKAAMRDAILTMKGELMERFGENVKRFVGRDLADPELLRTLVLEVAGRVRPTVEAADGPVEVLLPEKAAGLEELRRDPQELQEGKLTSLVLGLTRELLREGVVIATSEEVPGGIRVRIVEEGVELDVTEEAVAALLLKHLQPRFRAILEGVVR